MAVVEDRNLRNDLVGLPGETLIRPYSAGKPLFEKKVCRLERRQSMLQFSKILNQVIPVFRIQYPKEFCQFLPKVERHVKSN
jgi:hypothetical protein